MIEGKLNWDNVSWEDFETLILHLAEEDYPDCPFIHYLAHGSKQQGIDIRSFAFDNGKVITIQCKHEKKLGPADIDKIIADLSPEMKANSKQFILATTANLRSKQVSQKLEYYEEKLKREHNIQFSYSDRITLETKLKKQWRLVAYYFSEQAAMDFCYQQFREAGSANIVPVPDYIARKIFRLNGSSMGEKLDATYYIGRQPLHLLDTLSELEVTRKICILADAYQGKSFYLKNLAYELNSARKGICPLLLELKNINAGPIENMLNAKYGGWKTIPLLQIVLIIDGLDEVSTDTFGEIIRHVRAFAQAYNPITILLSCRRLFYAHYKVGEVLSSFDTYELYPLDYDEIQSWLQKKLEAAAGDFLSECYNKGITQWLYSPFFLVHMAEKFLKPPHRLPNSKLQLLDEVVQLTFDRSGSRRTKRSGLVSHDSVAFRMVCQKFAFALQFAGRNSFSVEEIQQLFNPQERDLMQHSSLISISATQWSFTNALFQEHLAARILADLPFNELLAFATIGSKNRKIKTKWIQTIASLFSILDRSHPNFLPLLQLLEEDSIELIFQTEATKHTITFQTKLIKKLIDRCMALNIRPAVVDEETIGTFIAANKDAIMYLVSVIEGLEATIRIKLACTHILRAARIPQQFAETIQSVVLAQLAANDDPDYAGALIDMLIHNKIADSTLLETLTTSRHHQNAHQYRSAVYHLIISMGDVGRFYNYGLQGLETLLSYNEKIHHTGSSYNLEEFLLATNNITQLAGLLKLMTTDQWVKFHELNARNKDFVKKVFDKLAEVFIKEPGIVLHIADFLRSGGIKSFSDDFREMDKLLNTPHANRLLVNVLLSDMYKKKWQLAGIIRKESFDLIIWEHENQNRQSMELIDLAYAAQHKSNADIVAEFLKLCDEATENFRFRFQPIAHREYQTEQLQKQKKDLRIIQSQEEFILSLKEFFTSTGKKNDTGNDYVLERRDKGRCREVNSSVMFRFLVSAFQKRPCLLLSECIALIDDRNYFDWFRSKSILEYPLDGEKGEKITKDILSRYYYEHLADSDFANCEYYNNDPTYEKKHEILLGEIFVKYQFNTPAAQLVAMIWLDGSGIHNFLHNSASGLKTLSQLVWESLAPAEIYLLRNQVLVNLRNGVHSDLVRGNHFALCKELQIDEAAELLLQEILTGYQSVSGMIAYLKVYKSLNGDIAQLLPLLKIMNDQVMHSFLYLIELLKDVDRPMVISSLHLALALPSIRAESLVSVAEWLAHFGQIEGLTYLVTMIKEHGRPVSDRRMSLSIQSLDTKAALSEVSVLVPMLVDPKFYKLDKFYESPRNVILGWLNDLAAKSESDLILVKIFLRKRLEELADEYPGASDLNWYIIRMEENFRESDRAPKTIKQISQALHQVSTILS